MRRGEADIAVMALGAQASLAQIAILRAGLERFGGNEFFIGISLTVWLVTGALGSAIFGRLGDRAMRRRTLIRIGAGLVSFGLAAGLIILDVLSTRLSQAGISPSPWAAIGWMTLATAPAAAASGVLFAWLVSVLSSEYSRGLSLTTVLESVGAAVGGMVLGSLMLDQLGTPGLAACVLLLGGLGVLFLTPPPTKLRAVNIAIFTVAGAVLFAWGAAELVPAPADHIVTDRAENRFGRFIAVSDKGQATVLSGSRTVVDCGDQKTGEIIAATIHALAPDAKKVLAPGSTSHDLVLLGSLPGKRVTLVTANRDLEDLARRSCGQNELNPVGIIVDDPMNYLVSSAGKWDVIVVRVGSPETLNSARMITDAAFGRMKGRLATDGLLLVTLGPAHPYPTDAETRVLAGVLAAAAGSFAKCRVLPLGDWIIACGDKGPDLDSVTANLAYFPIPRRFATNGFFADALEPMQLGRLERRLTAAGKAALKNQALAPVAQTDALLDWAGQHAPTLATARFAPDRDAAVWFLAFLPLLTILTWIFRPLRRVDVDAYIVSAVTGAIGITVELAMMSAVQTAYGTLQHWLGALIAAYMAGLGIGAFLAWRVCQLLPRLNGHARRLSMAFVGVTTFCALLACMSMTKGLDFRFGIPAALVVLGACAAACGAAFQIVAQRLRDVSTAGSSDMTGRMRGVDTAAAGVAAILATVVFLPIAGTAVVLEACTAACMILAVHKSA